MDFHLVINKKIKFDIIKTKDFSDNYIDIYEKHSLVSFAYKIGLNKTIFNVNSASKDISSQVSYYYMN